MSRGRLALAALLSGLAAPACAQSNPGVTAAPLLTVPLGARALGMGGAFTAVASDDSALEYNPAGLSQLNAQDVEFTEIAGAGQSTLQQFSYAGPTPFTGVTGYGYTTAAATLLASQSGTIQVNTLGGGGSLASTQSQSAGDDIVLEAGYAERVGLTPFEMKDGTYDLDHFLGVGAKFVDSTLVQSFHAQTASADAGYLVRQPQSGLSFGLSGLNLGGRLKYITVSDPLPTTVRAGVAWEGGVPAEYNVIVGLDEDYSVFEKLYHVNFGVEYFWLRTYGARIGYQFNRPEQAGLTIGFGLRWKGRVLIDYAWAAGDTLGNGQRFTISYRFGGVPPSVRARLRQAYIESSPEHEPVEGLEQSKPLEDEPPANPRPVPRERTGVPGWIY